MSCPEISHVGVLTVCVFYLAVCDRLKQSLISVGRLTSETKEKLKTGYIRRLFMVVLSISGCYSVHDLAQVGPK
jgi:hypothetical protein